MKIAPGSLGTMSSRNRLQAALDHQQPDRVPVDMGATFVTGIHVSALARLRSAVLGERPGHRIKVCEPYQMLGEVDDELRDTLGVDVVGSLARTSIFGTDESAWKPFTFWDGTELLVPHNFNLTIEEGSGDWLIYPEGDRSVPASARLPKGGYFFDAIIRQEPIDEDKLNPDDNTEEFKPFWARRSSSSISRGSGGSRSMPIPASSSSFPAPPLATSRWCPPPSSNTPKVFAILRSGT